MLLWRLFREIVYALVYIITHIFFVLLFLFLHLVQVVIPNANILIINVLSIAWTLKHGL